MSSKLKNYEEFELEYNYSVRHTNEYNIVLKDGKPIVLLNNNNNVYNQIFDFNPRVNSITMKNDKIIINFIVETEEYKNHDLNEFKVNIGYNDYDFIESKGIYHVEIPYDKISIPGKSVGIYLKFTDKNGFTFKKKFLSKTGPNNGANIKLYASKIHNYDNHSIYVYETFGGYISLAYREINYT
ncbi:MAG: hypothetical protein Q4P14_03025, partial [Methanobacteriaceae archaeon]|nr:hypothetical protein [Methanobacteriaceae archaeon]